MKNTISKSVTSEQQCRYKDRRKLVSLPFAATIVALGLAVSAIAADKPVELGSALGKSGDAFAKSLGVHLTVNKTTPKPGTAGKGYCVLTAQVPDLGFITLTTENGMEDGAIKYVQVYFADRTISTWQAAFAKLGIPFKDIKEDKRPNFTKYTLPPIEGKVWEGFFTAKDTSLFDAKTADDALQARLSAGKAGASPAGDPSREPQNAQDGPSPELQNAQGCPSLQLQEAKVK